MDVDIKKIFYATKIREEKFTLQDNKDINSILSRPEYLGVWINSFNIPDGFANSFFIKILDASNNDLVGLIDSYKGTEYFRGKINGNLDLNAILLSTNLNSNIKTKYVGTIDKRFKKSSVEYIGEEYSFDGFKDNSDVKKVFAISNVDESKSMYDSIYQQLRFKNLSRQS